MKLKNVYIQEYVTAVGEAWKVVHTTGGAFFRVNDKDIRLGDAAGYDLSEDQIAVVTQKVDLYDIAFYVPSFIEDESSIPTHGIQISSADIGRPTAVCTAQIDDGDLLIAIGTNKAHLIVLNAKAPKDFSSLQLMHEIDEITFVPYEKAFYCRCGSRHEQITFQEEDA